MSVLMIPSLVRLAGHVKMSCSSTGGEIRTRTHTSCVRVERIPDARHGIESNLLVSDAHTPSMSAVRTED